VASKAGKLVWFDLTVDNAEAVREFYQQVVGWTSAPVNMGDYNDYSMMAADGSGAAGICRKRGDNASQPSHWMIYIAVDDLDQCLTACEANGGKIRVPIRGGGDFRFAVIEDPAGAVCALFEQKDA
jgi:predicted enzyme related to lactoylglutathione lyase